MKLKKYQSEDCSILAQLFYDTVHTVNARDYSSTQLDAWATGNIDLSVWDKSFLEHETVVVEEDNVIVGFGDMDCNGYLDRLFVHKDYQGKGIATAILTFLERQAVSQNILRFTTHASITAKPFFEKHGYKVLSENVVIRQGVELFNFIMEKNSGN